MAKKIRTKKTVAKKVVVEEAVTKVKAPKFTVKVPKKVYLYVLILVLVTIAGYFARKTFFAASVNGQLVSRFSVIHDLEKQGGKKVLDTIILKTLINQEAKKRKLSVYQKELNEEMQKIEVNISSQGTTIEALLAQQGMTKSDLTEEIKLQLLVTKLVDNNIKVSQKEIDIYLESQKNQNTLDLGNATLGLDRVKAESVLRQQKLQAKIQAFVADLKAKAKINYFINY